MIALNLFVKARDLLKKIPKQDLHIHTNYTDGKNKILEYVHKAVKEKIEAICFTDHVDKSTAWFPAYKREILRCEEKFKKDLEIYCGIEVRAADYSGVLNTSPEIVDGAEIVMGVVHRYPDGMGGVYDTKSLTPKEAALLEYTTMIGLLENTRVDILGHPGGTYEKTFSEFPENLYVNIIKKAKKKRVAIELNPIYHKNFQSFLRLCIKINPLVSLGSNAHSLSEMGITFRMLEGYLSK